MNFVDRGYAILTRNEDGSNTVAIASGMDNGEPTNVIAKHVGVRDVRVDPGVTLRESGSRSYTAQIVEVSPAGGALRVRALRADESLTL
ncbi:MAG: hypothetical protein GEV03_15950 [Streptosporangiales bacterium]|nr:hypothetical protein [Streptosporangiales bacterium]